MFLVPAYPGCLGEEGVCLVLRCQVYRERFDDQIHGMHMLPTKQLLFWTRKKIVTATANLVSHLYSFVTCSPVWRSQTDDTIRYNKLFMAALRSRCRHYVFALWFLLSSSAFIFPRLISPVGNSMSTILPHLAWP